MDAGRAAGSASGPPYKAKAIANFFLAKGEAEGMPLSNMKLQKLVYFAHGWHLALIGAPLIDERIQAWEFGPVVRTLYDEFKSYGSAPITGRAQSLETTGAHLRFFEPDVPSTDTQTVALLDRVWETYKKFNAYQLSALTHTAGSPWDVTWSANTGVRNVTIDDDAIRTAFAKAADANRAARKAS